MSDIQLADFLTEEKLAEQLGCHERTVARWRMKGSGPRFTSAGRRVIYNKDDVTAWLRSGGTAAPQQGSKRARARRSHD
jgi:predicted site-specific integrase-resolvase